MSEVWMTLAFFKLPSSKFLAQMHVGRSLRSVELFQNAMIVSIDIEAEPFIAGCTECSLSIKKYYPFLTHY